jgi:hypothetical protein
MEGKSRKSVYTFTEPDGKDKVVIYHPERGEILRMEIPTERLDERVEGPYGNIREFRGSTRRGDIIDVGEGGTFFSKDVRFGVVDREGEIVWLKDGSERDAMDALTESMNLSGAGNNGEDNLSDPIWERYTPTRILHSDRDKRDVAVSSSVQIAEKMLQIQNGKVVAIMKGMDGEEKPFYLFSRPFDDPLELTDSESTALVLKEFNEILADSIARGEMSMKEVLSAQCTSYSGLIRFPREIVRSFPKGRIAPEYYDRMVQDTAIAILNDPEKWITEI